ncbi:MAG: TRAP transporter large permease subunit [Deltaproteobacteria bacterium]|nr:TRAP transporter large permease subunit [Deltaproteobacteria bacterium]
MIATILLVADLAFALLAYRKRKAGLVIWLALCVGVFAFTSKVSFLVIGTIAAALLLGLPLFVVMGAIGVLLLSQVSGLSTLDDLTVVPRKLLELASKEVLLAIPFFVVAGELMTQGSLARRLIDVMQAFFGFLPGGLAVAGVAGCVFFAAISGSSPVTVVAIGSIMVPALTKQRYPEGFSIGLMTTAGSLGILIPPSIPMIVYAIMVSSTTPMDPRDLFMAGVVPGLFIGALLGLYAIAMGVKQRIPRAPFSWATARTALRRGVWSLLLPVIILGGIYTGVFTATEAAAVSVIYALVIEIFVHKELDAKRLVTVATTSMTVMGALLVIIALAITLNYFLVLEGVPDAMVEWLRGLGLERAAFLVVVNVLLLVVGCFMDIMSAILIIAPMLAPMALAMQIHPIHMAIVFIVNLEIGYLTPPVGLNLFVSSTLFKKSLGFVIRAVLPTLAIMFVSLLVITWVPGMSLGLLRLMGSEAVVDDEPRAQPAVVDAGPSAAVDAGPARAKTLAELMADMKAKGDGGVDVDAGGAAGAPAPSKPKTMAELMAEMKARQAADAGDAAVDAGP